MATHQRIVQTDETLPLAQALPLAPQHLMAMFGATVLVPILTGLDPGVGLMTSGIGTILYLICVRNKIPSYLGSSFAFIAPLIAVGRRPGRRQHPRGARRSRGRRYRLHGRRGLVKAFGTGWLNKLLPPALVGAVVIVIGLGLSATAVKMSMFPIADPTKGIDLHGVLDRGDHARLGHRVLELLQGLHEDDSGAHGHHRRLRRRHPARHGRLRPGPTRRGSACRTLTFPKFDLGAILIIAPVAFVVIVEHIGHLLVINEITGKDFTADAARVALRRRPRDRDLRRCRRHALDHVRREHRRHGGHEGLRHPALLVRRRLRVRHRRLRAEVRRAISSIPTPVMGGISLLLFGLIASSGLRLLVKSGIDYSHSRNLIMSSVVLVIGIGMETGGFTIPLGNYTIPGMALATLVGMILNLILPRRVRGWRWTRRTSSQTAGRGRQGRVTANNAPRRRFRSTAPGCAKARSGAASSLETLRTAPRRRDCPLLHPLHRIPNVG